MVARTNDDKAAGKNKRTRGQDDRKQREQQLDRAREIQHDFLVGQLDQLAGEFGDNPEQIGHYLADLELAGMLSPADKGMLFRRLWETMGPAFADRAFQMTDSALARDIAQDIQSDAYLPQGQAFVSTPDELRRVNEASQVLQTLARTLGLSIDTPRAQLRSNFDANIADIDPERAAKTRELLDVLGPQLGVDTDNVDVHVDEAGHEATGEQGIYGLMTGGEVFLDPEIYDPETADGRGLLAHEVVHIAQYENRLRGANDLPDIGAAEQEADVMSSRFAAGGPVEAPLAILGSYDKAACGPMAMQEKETPKEEPKEDPKKEEPKKEEPRTGKTETVVVDPVYEIIPGSETPQIKVPPIHFHVDKHQLHQTLNPAAAARTLKMVATTLERYPEISKVKIEGFTSTTGSAKHNKELSNNRAKSMEKELVGKYSEKMPGVQFESIGWGEDVSKLKSKDKRDSKEYAINRRTEFNIAAVKGKQVGPDWQPTQHRLKTPGYTIIKHIGPDGKVIKEEKIENGGVAKELPPGTTKEAAKGKAPTTGGGGAAKTEKKGGGDKNDPKNIAKKNDAPKTEPAESKAQSPSSCGGGGGAAAGPGGGGQESAEDDKKKADPGNEDPGTTKTPTEKMVFRARVSARQRRRLRAANKAKRIKGARRFAGPVLRRVAANAQAKADVGGLTSRQLSDSTQSGSGERLPGDIRTKFESAFGTSFDDVRIHRGSAQATGIGATAFARGTDIHFAPGRFDPSSSQGLATLGHELTHVVQQRAGRVSVPQGYGTHVNVDRGLEAEADLLGSKASRGERVHVEGSSASLYSRAARGGADMVLFEGGATAGSATAPTEAKVKLAGQEITARMPAGATPGLVRVDFGTAASVAGLRLGAAELEFDANWEITRGTIKAGVSIGEYVRAEDITLQVQQKTEGTTKFAEVSADIRGARFAVPDLFDGTIDLRIANTGISGTANIQAAAMRLGAGITLTSGQATISLAGDGAITASGSLNGTIEGVGEIIVTAQGIVGGKFTAGVEFRLTAPKTIVEGVEITAGSIKGTYTHKEKAEVKGQLTVKVRNWVEGQISAEYVHSLGAGGGGGGGAPAPAPAPAPGGGGGGGGGGGTAWKLKGTLVQKTDFGVGAGESKVDFKNASLDVDFANGQFVKTTVKTDYDMVNFKGRVEGSFDVQKAEASAKGSIEMKPLELPLGTDGVKLKMAKAEVVVEKNVLKTIKGDVTVTFPYENQPTFELNGKGLLVKVDEKKVSGTATLKVMRDLPFGNTASYNAVLLKDATANVSVTDNKLGGAAAGMKFDVKLAAEKIGDGSIDLNLGNDPSKLNATAKFTLVKDDFGVPDAAVGPIKLKKGGEFNLSVENSAFKTASVKNVKYEVKQEGEGATGKFAGEINGTFDFPTTKLDATGNGALKGDWVVPPEEGVNLVFKEGGKIDIAIAASKLTKVDGEFKYEMKLDAKDKIPQILVDGKLVGQYSSETKKFKGELDGKLKENINIPMGQTGQDKLEVQKGANFKATVANNKPGVLEIGLDAKYFRGDKHFLTGHIDKAMYTLLTGSLDFKGDLTLEQKVEKATEDGKWKFVVLPGSKVGAEVEKSALKVLTGQLPFELHDSACLAKGNLTEAKLDVEKLEFTAKLDLALARDMAYPRGADGAEAPSPLVQLIAQKDISKLNGSIEKNKFIDVGAVLNFKVNLGGKEYGSGDVTGKLDIQKSQFDGAGKIKLDKDLYIGGVERKPATGEPIQSWVLAFEAGQGVDVAVKKNQLDEANINLKSKLYNDAIEVANGSVQGRYKLGETDGFNGSVDANVIKNLDWSNEGRWHYWVEEGTKFNGTVEKTAVKSISGDFKLLMKDQNNGSKDAIRVKFNGGYTPGTGFNAAGSIDALDDVKVGDGNEFSVFIAKDSKGGASVKGKKVEKVTGNVTLQVKKGADKFAKGEFTVDYDASNANAKIDATGKVTLEKRTEVGAVGDWKFDIVDGTGVDFSLLKNELQYVKGQIKTVANYKGDCIEGVVNANYQHAGQKKFDADGAIKVTAPIRLGTLMSGEYKFDIVPSTGATFDVKDSKLKTIGGKINVEVSDTSLLAAVELDGKYTHEGTKFDGKGAITLKRTVEVGKSPDGVYKFNILSSTGAQVTVANNKLDEIKGTLKANVEKEGEFAYLEGEVTARKPGQEWKVTTIGAGLTLTKDKELPIKNSEWKVTVKPGTGATIKLSENKLDEIGGTLKVQIEKGVKFGGKVDLTGKYTPNDGFSGDAVGSLMYDFKVGESAPYNFWALKEGTEAKLKVTNSAVDKIGGKVNFKVDEGEAPFVKGSASVDYDFKGSKLIEAKGEGVLAVDKTLGTWNGFTLIAKKDSSCNFLAQNSELKRIGGQLNLQIDDKDGKLALGLVTADFDVKNAKFTGGGKVNLVRDYAVSVEGKNGKGQPESWGLCLKSGGGLDIQVKENVFESCQVDVECVGYHNGTAKADGKLTGRYKAGDPEGFTGSIDIKATQRIPLYEKTGQRFDYHIDPGTGLNGQVSKGSITQATVKANLAATEGTQDKIKLTGSATYTKGAGVDGSLTVLVVNDIKIKEANPWKLWLAKDSGGNATFSKSKLDTVSGSLKLRVDKGDTKFATGDFTASYAVKDGENAKVDATGTVQLHQKTDITPEGAGEFKIYVCEGTGIAAAVKSSELDYISGQIKGELEYKGKRATFDVNGKYQALGTKDFTGSGSLTTLDAIDIIDVKGYKLKLGTGAGITGSVKAFALERLTANIPLWLCKGADTIVDVKLNGSYTHADKKFDGTGTAEVKKQIEVAKDVGDYSFYIEPGATNASATVTGNELKELKGTLVVGVHDKESKFLKATAQATYTAGEPKGTVTVEGSVEVTREKEMIKATAAGYSAWLMKGSSATVKVTNNNLDKIGGTIETEIRKDGKFATISLTGDYTKDTGFKGTGKATLHQDVKIIETKVGGENFTLWVLKGAGATIELENSDIKKVSGNVTAVVRDAEGPAGNFIKVTVASAEYDFPGKKFSGSGSVEVCKDKKLATFNGEELWLAKGSGATGEVKDNQLQSISGNVCVKLKDTAFWLEAKLNGSFDAKGTEGFSGTGSVEVLRDKQLAQLGDYRFFLAKGAGATAKIDKNALTEVTGKVPFKIYDAESEPLLVGSAEGKYVQATKKFSGNGDVKLGRNVTYPLSSGKLIFKKDSGGGGSVVDNKLEKLTGKLMVDIHDGTGPFVACTAEGTYNAVTNKIEKAHGAAKLLRTIDVGTPPAVRIKTLSGDVWVENNEVKKIEGELGVELPSLSKNGAKAEGKFKGGWEKTASEDVFWGSGEIDFTVFKTGDRSLSGKVKGEYKRDKTFNFAGELDYQMNPNLRFKARVAVDQTLDPVVGATAEVSGIKLADARDLFKWDKDFPLLKGTAMAGPVPIAYAGGVGVGLGLSLKQTNFGAKINFDGWRPVSAPGQIPDFQAELSLTTGLLFKAAVRPWLTFGIGVSGVVSAGIGIQAEGAVTVDVGVTPTGRIWGKAGKYGGELDLGLKIVGSGDLSISPIAYAELLGKKWDYEITKVNQPLGQLFSFDYNYKFGFGDQGGNATKGGAPAKTVPAVGRTQPVAPYKSAPPKDPATVGGLNQPAPVKGGADMSGGKGDAKQNEGPMAEMQGKLDKVQEVGAKIGRIAKALGVIVEALGWVLKIPFPFGIVVAGGYLAYKHYSGECDFAQVWKDIKDIWTLVEESGAIQKIMPDWLIKLYDQLKGKSLSQALVMIIDFCITKLKNALPDWAGGAIDALRDAVVGMGRSIVNIVSAVRNGISGGLAGVKAFASMLVDLGGAVASIGYRLARDAAAAAAEAVGDALDPRNWF